MTQREFLQAIEKGLMTAQLQEQATERLQKLDIANARKASKPSKTSIANEPLKQKILEILGENNEQLLTSVIGERANISTSKATALCKQLKDSGKIFSEEKKIPKAGTRMVWKLVEDKGE